MQTIDTDYLIVGAGAVGMAFADSLLRESPDARMVIVDRNAKPGGHWNQAYPFVTLHQPSAFYGVESRELSNGKTDQAGLNMGLGHLATGAEVSAYFDAVMLHTLIPSGRVQYFPMSDYQGDGVFTSKLSGESHKVTYKKRVDGTFLNPALPSTHTPNFTVSETAQFMPLNDLPQVTTPPAGFVVIGGGKTGIDAVLWLLQTGVPADKITWILSRDGWMIDRKNTQPTMEFFEDTIGTQAAQFEALAAADSVEDLFDRLEACGYFVRLDPNVRPSMFHAATVSQAELTAMRQVKSIVRMGRVKAIEADKIILTNGEIPTSPDHIHVDCSASAIVHQNTKPIFDGDVITPQTVRSYQASFSAALIAHIEMKDWDEAKKNETCRVVPIPNADIDFLPMTAVSMLNQYMWSQDKELQKWMHASRLDAFSGLIRGVDSSDKDKIATLMRVRESAMPAMNNLLKLIEGAGLPAPF